MQRVGAIVTTLALAACSHQTAMKDATAPEPWFHRIRAVAGKQVAQCRQIASVETHIEATKLVPPVPREDYRRTRRVAFDEFEAKVLAVDGNAVRIDIFRESGSAGGAPFALDAIHLIGEALDCP